MPFDGTGVFNRIYSWATDAANGVLVRSDRMDTDTNDIAAGLSMCITKDGQQTLTANIPMSGFKFTGLGAGVSPADSVTYSQVFSSPAFTSPSAVASPSNSDNSLLLATTAYVTQKAFSAALPAQGGNPSKWLFTDGVNASWSDPIPARAGNLGKVLMTLDGTSISFQPVPGNDSNSYFSFGGF